MEAALFIDKSFVGELSTRLSPAIGTEKWSEAHAVLPVGFCTIFCCLQYIRWIGYEAPFTEMSYTGV